MKKWEKTKKKKGQTKTRQESDEALSFQLESVRRSKLNLWKLLCLDTSVPDSYLVWHLYLLMLTPFYIYACLKEQRNNIWTQPTLALLFLFNGKKNSSYFQTDSHSQHSFSHSSENVLADAYLLIRLWHFYMWFV